MDFSNVNTLSTFLQNVQTNGTKKPVGFDKVELNPVSERHDWGFLDVVYPSWVLKFVFLTPDGPKQRDPAWREQHTVDENRFNKLDEYF